MIWFSLSLIQPSPHIIINRKMETLWKLHSGLPELNLTRPTLQTKSWLKPTVSSKRQPQSNSLNSRESFWNRPQKVTKRNTSDLEIETWIIKIWAHDCNLPTILNDSFENCCYDNRTLFWMSFKAYQSPAKSNWDRCLQLLKTILHFELWLNLWYGL